MCGEGIGLEIILHRTWVFFVISPWFVYLLFLTTHSWICTSYIMLFESSAYLTKCTILRLSLISPPDWREDGKNHWRAVDILFEVIMTIALVWGFYYVMCQVDSLKKKKTALMLISLPLSLFPSFPLSPIPSCLGWSIRAQGKDHLRLLWTCPLQLELVPSKELKHISSGQRSAGTSPTGQGA